MTINRWMDIFMCVCVCVCLCVCVTHIYHTMEYFSAIKKNEILSFYDNVDQFSSVAQSCPTFYDPWTAAHQASLSITNSGAYSNSCPSSWWCHPTISSSVVPFSSCLQSFPASGSFPMSQFFASGGQTIRVSASASPVLSVNIQVWFPLGLTG